MSHLKTFAMVTSYKLHLPLDILVRMASAALISFSSASSFESSPSSPHFSNSNPSRPTSRIVVLKVRWLQCSGVWGRSCQKQQEKGGRLVMKTCNTMALSVAVVTKSTAVSSRQLQKWKVLG